jgi:hypothetical protein
MADGTQVKILSSTSKLGPVGAVVTLSNSVASAKISGGEVEAYGTAQTDGGTVRIISHECDYPYGATVTLSYSVAQRLIAAGIAEAV